MESVIITLKEKHKMELGQIKGDLNALKGATSFTLSFGEGYIKNHCVCDSSDRREERMIFIEKAINSMKREILDKAVEICTASIGYDDYIKD